MFIPSMVGVLAAVVLIVAAILAATQARRAARVFAFAGLGLTVLAVGLAVETEVRYRDCRNDPPVRAMTLDDQIDRALGDDAAVEGRAAARCERWPW